MRWMEKVKKNIRSWLNVQEASPTVIQINEVVDYEANAIRNRIWYRGDSSELQQLYASLQEYADKYKFWASAPTPGMEIRKIHTGLPNLIVKTLASIVLADLNDLKFSEGSEKHQQLWTEIEADNKFQKLLSRALKEILYVGDGAFKITFDPEIGGYPILEFYSGERLDLVYRRGRVQEIIFKTPYQYDSKRYTLHEHYGYGYVQYHLYGESGAEVELSLIPDTAGLVDVIFDKSFMMAVPIRVFESAKWDGRGQSLFDGKIDSFDAFDEAWSQWMDALRAGRSKTYIPECLLPKNPEDGSTLRQNPFDNRYIKTESDLHEGAANKIDVEQPDIPHESYLATYVTALDLCLQGIISPSTLGIDVKKLDNAEAQREKEKATLYTRNAIVEALQETIPEVISAAINAYYTMQQQPLAKIEVEVPFGEYANPSFESTVETLAKARPGSAVMSVEAQVEEMWGDSKSEEWKSEEIERLKAEMGIAEAEEPAVAGADSFAETNGLLPVTGE